MDSPISKSQKKREADALQTLGVKLIGLAEESLEELPLTDPLRQAIIEAKSIKSFGATRRQAQLIGKLMRSADAEAIQAAYLEIMAKHNANTAEFQQCELWRQRLLHETKPALTAFIAAYPEVDTQKLRQLVKKAASEEASGNHSGAAKALFRFLKAATL